MPTTRRKAAATPSTRNQSTLSFNNKSARITKPSQQDTPTTKKAQSKLSEPIQEIEIETPEPETAEVEVEAEQDGTGIAIPVSPVKKRKISKVAGKSEREVSAEKVTDAQIKKYWKAEEDARLAPRGMFFLRLHLLSDSASSIFYTLSPKSKLISSTVHQKDVALHEKILRHFDLSSQYGPCIGITRLSRWKRADTLGLEPPVEVLAVLLREENKSTSQGCGKIAYIDALGGGKVGIVE
jgi:DNA polymerase delta subunit 4